MFRHAFFACSEDDHLDRYHFAWRRMRSWDRLTCHDAILARGRGEADWSLKYEVQSQKMISPNEKSGDLMKTKWDEKFHAFYGDFSTDDCKVRRRSTGGRTSCCGEFPDRFPFSADTR